MRPDGLETSIFKSIPTSFTFNTKTYTIGADYAHLASVRDMLSSVKVAITISYFNDQNMGGIHSPTNLLLKYDAGSDDDTVVNLVGQRYTCIMSVNIHVAQSDMYDAVGILNYAVKLMQKWQMLTLRDYTEVLNCSAVTDLSHLDDGLLRKQFDVTIRYPMAVWETLNTVRYVEGAYHVVEGQYSGDASTFFIDLKR